jgi:hypothetical protein
MPDTSSLQCAQAGTSIRLRGDIERILSTRDAVNAAASRVAGHTFMLGYLTPAGVAGGISEAERNNGKPGQAPTLQSALGDLDGAVEGLNTALALLDC